MKLLAAALLLAATVTGCATDDDYNGGGYLAGLRPAKPSFDSSQEAQYPDVSTTGNQLTGMIDVSKGPRTGPLAVSISDGDYPLPGKICDGCEVTLVTVNTKTTSGDFGVGDIDVVNDGGEHLCTLHLDPGGNYDATDCNRLAN